MNNPPELTLDVQDIVDAYARECAALTQRLVIAEAARDKALALLQESQGATAARPDEASN